MMNTYSRSRFHSIAYRLAQVREQLGFVAPLTAQDDKEVAALLPTAAALSLFRTMSPADQQHSLRVCRRLIARGCKDKDMLAAALLHDVGKAQGRVPFWTRPASVLGKKLAPHLLTRLVTYPEKGPVTRRGGRGEEEGRGPLGRPRPQSGKGTIPRRGGDPGTVLTHETLGGNEEQPPQGDRKGSPLLYSEDTAQACSSIVGAIPCGRPVGAGCPAYGGCPTAHGGRPDRADRLFGGDRPDRAGRPLRANIPNWRLSLSYAWYHADVGADLASAAGLSERAVLYIRTHHQPGGPAAELHEVDEVS